MLVKKLLIFICLLILASCGGGHNPDENLSSSPDNKGLGGSNYKVIGSSKGLVNSVKGVGTLAFDNLPQEVESNNNYTLNFELNENEEIIFFTHTLDNLDKGINIIFSRLNNSSSLKVTLSVAGYSFDISSDFTTVDATRALSLSIDVHNNHGGSSHLIVWDNNNLPDQEIFDKSIPGRGFGKKWGVDLRGARFFSGQLAPAKDKH